MNEEIKAEEVRLAKRLEAAGQFEAAVKIYERIELYEESARVLLSKNLFAKAGESLLTGIGDDARKIKAATAEQKRRIKKAAVCFANAGDGKRGANLLLALGDQPGAADLLDRTGLHAEAAQLRDEFLGEKQAKLGRAVAEGARGATPEDLERAGHLLGALHAYAGKHDFLNAARVAHKMGKPVEAARLFLDGHHYFEAATCFLKANDEASALDAVKRISREDPKYRDACSLAIRLSVRSNSIDFQTDYLIGDYVRSGPGSEKEAEEFYALAQLYTRHDFAENAVEALRALLDRFPTYRDATKQLEALGLMSMSSAVQDRVRAEQEAFLRRGMPSEPAMVPGAHDPMKRALLPSLPPLSSPPPGFRGAAAGASPATAIGFEKTGQVAAPVQITGDDIAPGSIISSRYRIERAVGKGGMGAVYEAFDLELNERIALKFYYGETNTEMLERFRRELALSRRLAHTNIVKVYDIGSFGGAKYMSMELLEGSDLKRRIENGLSFEDACNFLAQGCRGLAFAHAQGVVHRDVKPDNLFITQAQVVKVMDFGIAKQQHTPGLTQTGFIAGTPGFMAPEQINNFATVDQGADIYAMGVIAFLIFTGRMPFEAEELVPLLMAHVNDPPPKPRLLNPKIPQDLEDMILRLLAKSPAARPRDAGEVAAYFEHRLEAIARAKAAFKNF
jgi:tetratricopeptide (TPR) repeat protein